ncbi:MAG: CooT family nickel-binding protein [Pseudomonadota bacterium]
MCEANAYFETSDGDELIIEAVDLLEPEDDGTYILVSIFGEQKTVRGRLKKMNLVDHKILFVET